MINSLHTKPAALKCAKAFITAHSCLFWKTGPLLGGLCLFWVHALNHLMYAPRLSALAVKYVGQLIEMGRLLLLRMDIASHEVFVLPGRGS